MRCRRFPSSLGSMAKLSTWVMRVMCLRPPCRSSRPTTTFFTDPFFTTSTTPCSEGRRILWYSCSLLNSRFKVSSKSFASPSTCASPRPLKQQQAFCPSHCSLDIADHSLQSPVAGLGQQCGATGEAKQTVISKDRERGSGRSSSRNTRQGQTASTKPITFKARTSDGTTQAGLNVSRGY